MKFTEFFKLKKPTGNEYYNVNVHNDNSDVIDRELHALDALISAHANYQGNPHGVTKKDLGLDHVDNTSDMTKPLSNAALAALAKKQDKLQYDINPTRGSVNFLTSGALFTAFANKMDKMDVDISPQANSLNLVYSNGVYQFVQKMLKVFIPGTRVGIGTDGLVPAPTYSEREKFLRGDGTWATPESVISEETEIQVREMIAETIAELNAENLNEEAIKGYVLKYAPVPLSTEDVVELIKKYMPQTTNDEALRAQIKKILDEEFLGGTS